MKIRSILTYIMLSLPQYLNCKTFRCVYCFCKVVYSFIVPFFVVANKYLLTYLQFLGVETSQSLTLARNCLHKALWLYDRQTIQKLVNDWQLEIMKCSAPLTQIINGKMVHNFHLMGNWKPGLEQATNCGLITKYMTDESKNLIKFVHCILIKLNLCDCVSFSQKSCLGEIGQNFEVFQEGDRPLESPGTSLGVPGVVQGEINFFLPPNQKNCVWGISREKLISVSPPKHKN